MRAQTFFLPAPRKRGVLYPTTAADGTPFRARSRRRRSLPERKPHPGFVQMTRGDMTGHNLAQRGGLDSAARHCVGAALVEVTARGRVDRARHIACQDDPLAPP